MEHNFKTAIETSNYYDKRWQCFTERNKLTRQEKLRIGFIVQALNDLVGRKDLKILDLGCGRGWMAPYLAEWGTVTGLDFTIEGINIANRQFGKYGTFLLAKTDLPKLGIPRNQMFDIIVCSEVIEHVYEQRNLLFQISSLLIKNGYCILTTPNGNVWPQFSRNYKDNLQPIEIWLKPKELVALLNDTGFKVIRHEGGVFHLLRFGPFSWFQRRLVQKFFRLVGLSHFYSRFALPMAIYQLVVARKIV